MPGYLTDAEILTLLEEPKPLPPDYRRRLVPKPKRGHSESELELEGAQGSIFRLIIRQAHANALDFSVILAYCIPKSTQVTRLRRYNGRHEHTNPMEGETFYGFHVHQATERYQQSGNREDTYATPADRYADLQGAIDCMVKECGFVMPSGPEMPLFDPRDER